MKGVAEITISTELVKKVQKEVELSEGFFTSVSDYVEFVLRELFTYEEDRALSSEERRMVCERLRALGYIE
jgi:Arc/MetJ-type ribon-helix-helix transcriptional regulator